MSAIETAGQKGRGDLACRSVAIIGAGPAGLMAAQIVAQAGHRVSVYERMAAPARKLLMAGRGGLNLTHSEDMATFLSRYGTAQDWLEPALRAFPPSTLRQWADGLGQQTFTGSSGRIFPKSMKASPLLRAWLRQLDERGVVLNVRHCWNGWDEEGNLRFTIDGPRPATVGDAAGAGNAYNSKCLVPAPDALLLAMGGASWPRLGSTGTWSDLLRARGVAVTPFAPANNAAQVAWSGYFIDKFAGVPLKNIVLRCQGQTRRGELMITARGLEGGALYALSGTLRAVLARDGCAQIEIDLCPAVDQAVLEARLSRPRGKSSLANHLRKRARLSSVATALLRESVGGSLPQSSAELAALIKTCCLTVTGMAGFERAISSAGGISHSAIDDTFMLKALPGTFAAGEMLDWEAPTGGYLLQATFSTAVAAAQGLNGWLALLASRAK